MNEWSELNKLIGKKVIEIRLNVNGFGFEIEFEDGNLLEIHDHGDMEFQDENLMKKFSGLNPKCPGLVWYVSDVEESK